MASFSNMPHDVARPNNEICCCCVLHKWNKWMLQFLSSLYTLFQLHYLVQKVKSKAVLTERVPGEGTGVF